MSDRELRIYTAVLVLGIFIAIYAVFKCGYLVGHSQGEVLGWAEGVVACQDYEYCVNMKARAEKVERNK